jgi:hypothetical protein
MPHRSTQGHCGGPNRYRGTPYAWIVASLVGHTTAHATQIRQFAAAFADTRR